MFILRSLVCANLAFGSTAASRALYERTLQSGVKHMTKGVYADALANLTMASVLKPKEAPPRFRLGELAEKSMDLPRAVFEYKTCLVLDPKYAACRSRLSKLEQKRRVSK